LIKIWAKTFILRLLKFDLNVIILHRFWVLVKNVCFKAKNIHWKAKNVCWKAKNVRWKVKNEQVRLNTHVFSTTLYSLIIIVIKFLIIIGIKYIILQLLKSNYNGIILILLKFLKQVIFRYSRNCETQNWMSFAGP